MIEKINKISKVRIQLYGEPLVNSLPNQEIIDSEVELPLNFNYNGSWEVEHNCSSCSNRISFGFHYEQKNRYPRYSYQQTNYWCSRFYSNEFLLAVFGLFEKSKLVQLESLNLIVYDDFIVKNFPITSSIKPIVYSCENCNSEYLGVVYNYSPQIPERGNINGTLGQIQIKEIIEIKSLITPSFTKLLESHEILLH